MVSKIICSIWPPYLLVWLLEWAFEARCGEKLKIYIRGFCCLSFTEVFLHFTVVWNKSRLFTLPVFGLPHQIPLESSGVLKTLVIPCFPSFLLSIGYSKRPTAI